MERTDTSGFAGRSYATLSGGERTRVSLARVLAQETPIVLLDEPTTALDVGHQERVMREAVRLGGEGRTIVVVLHDLNAAARYGDRVALMHRGRVVAHGAASDVLQPELLSSVYDQPMVVIDHPLGRGLLVLVDEESGGVPPLRS
jgi:iron complex transport system ATP-binding protein